MTDESSPLNITGTLKAMPAGTTILLPLETTGQASRFIYQARKGTAARYASRREPGGVRVWRLTDQAQEAPSAEEDLFS